MIRPMRGAPGAAMKYRCYFVADSGESLRGGGVLVSSGGAPRGAGPMLITPENRTALIPIECLAPTLNDRTG